MITVRFSGLCLFVPQPGTAMHVLMPAALGLTPHETILSFPAVHIVPSPPSTFPKDLYVHVPITGCDVVIGWLPWSGSGWSVPSDAPHLSDLGAKADPVHLSGAFDSALATRVRLGEGTSRSLTVDARTWDWNHQTAPLAHDWTWAIDLPASAPAVTLSLPPQSGIHLPVLPELYPVSGEIALEVLHVGRSEFPPVKPMGHRPPEEKAPALFFESYYALCTNVATLALPRFTPGQPTTSSGSYSCMVAVAQPGP
jgi:hypothetical protein